MVASSAPALEPLRRKGLELTHITISPQRDGRFVVERHFTTRRDRYPQGEAWDDRPLGEALELARRILDMEGLG
jgi:hypothetical protein